MFRALTHTGQSETLIVTGICQHESATIIFYTKMDVLLVRTDCDAQFGCVCMPHDIGYCLSDNSEEFRFGIE